MCDITDGKEDSESSQNTEILKRNMKIRVQGFIAGFNREPLHILSGEKAADLGGFWSKVVNGDMNVPLKNTRVPEEYVL